MATVTILGAGAMGSALATPAVAAGNRVRLWGTWLDDGILAELRAGRPHPRTGVPVDPRVELHDAGGLAAALDGADLVALAISSEGPVLEVARRAAAAGLAPGTPLLLCTKGFGRRPDGRVELLPALLARRPRPAGASCPVVAVGGPCKANEVAAGRPTAAVFGGRRRGGRRSGARGPWPPPPTGSSAAATSTGWRRPPPPRTSTRSPSASATASPRPAASPGTTWPPPPSPRPWPRCGAWRVALGGREETVLGLAGVGDLEVTSLSGRNRVFGTRVGRGEPPAEALAAMAAAGQTVEGVPAARLARELAAQLAPGRPAGWRPAGRAATAGGGQPHPRRRPRPGRPTRRGRPPP